jgi:hypothetical protein
MSTIDTNGAGAVAPATPAPSSTPPPAPAPPPGPAAAPADDLFADLPEDQPLYDRGWVDKIRREGQRYREEARTAAEKLGGYDTVFGAYDQADRDVWFNLAQTWATDPVRAAQMMGAIANTVLGDQTPAPAAGGGGPGESVPPEPTAPALDGELTPEKVQQMIADALGQQQAQYAQSQQAAAEQAAVNEVYSEVRTAGYDPDSMEGFMVLWLANNNTGGDIAAAAQALTTYRQGIVDEYVAGRRSGVTPLPSGGSSAAPEAMEIKNLDDARRAADAYLRAQAQ